MNLSGIARKYIKENKKNSILIIISIIISTALFLLMNIISEDARNLMIDQAKKGIGIQHSSYSNPTNKEIEYLKNNPEIDRVGKTMLLGLHNIGKGQTLQILWDDKVSQDISNSYKLKTGKLATNENEITLDTWYLDQNKIKNPIGKTIKLDYNGLDKNGETLYTGKKEFKIVGILQSNPALKAQGISIGFISKDCAMKNIPLEDKYNQATFMFKKEKNIPKQVKNLVKDGNLNEDNINLNNSLILAMSDSLSLKIPYIIVNMMLALATILLIYNIFYILVSNRIKDFGVLRAVGFIPSDISKIMILEVLIYSIISIPIGLILGGVMANLCSTYIIGVIYDINYVNAVKSSSYFNAYIVSILLSVFTISISVSKPLITTSKIDPMVCMRRSEEEININKKSPMNKIMTIVFKDYGNIASKNIQRNKKRTNLAIASMTIVFFLMLTVYTKSTSNFLDDGGLRLWIPGDYLIHNIDILSSTQNEKNYDSNVLKEIKNIEGIKKVNASRDKIFYINIDDDRINKRSAYWKECKDVLERGAKVENNKKVYQNSIETLGIEDEEILNDVVIEGKENLSKLHNEPYIYIDKDCSKSLNIKPGDTLNVDFKINDYDTGKYRKTVSKDFIVGGIIKYLPLTSQGAGTSFGGVISVNQMNKFTGVSSYERFDVWTSSLANNKYIDSEINKIIEKSGKGIVIPYKSESSGIEKGDNQKTMIMVLVIGVIVILSLFNCCNTIVTSINSRSREFALLRGIGISQDEIKKIVKLEGLVYVFNGFIFSIIPSLIVRYMIIKDFENISLINFKFIAVIMAITALLTSITMITTIKSLKHAQSEDFIQQIKTLQ